MKRLLIILSVAVLMTACSAEKEPWKPSPVCIKGLEYIISESTQRSGEFKVEPTGYTCSGYEYTRGNYIKAEDETKADPEDKSGLIIEEEEEEAIDSNEEIIEDDSSVETM